MKTPVCAIFDIGKTNKKLFLFDENYQIVYEKSVQFDETLDEDGDACEDLFLLTKWVKSSWQEIKADERFDVKALNFSTYGASFVHIGSNGLPLTPLYNYLKNYPEALKQQFYDAYEGEQTFAVKTASPVLGSLNSGMQIYRLKYEAPQTFRQIKYSLHLPQYLCFLITGEAHTDITSIGCHTNLWDFQQNQYHEWVQKEGISRLLPPILNNSSLITHHSSLITGIGLHDSSAALIPYLATFQEPFALLSTGTWCITMNSFNDNLLTFSELKDDCLCYLTYKGKPVKASRLFAGNEHEQQTKRIAEYFGLKYDFFKEIAFDKPMATKFGYKTGHINTNLANSKFVDRSLNEFQNANEAYHCLIADIMEQQVFSSRLVLDNTNVKRLFVDGGFSKNPIYMGLLAEAFPKIEVCAASVAQATSLGAAVAIHEHWNTKPLPKNLVEIMKV